MKGTTRGCFQKEGPGRTTRSLQELCRHLYMSLNPRPKNRCCRSLTLSSAALYAILRLNACCGNRAGVKAESRQAYDKPLDSRESTLLTISVTSRLKNARQGSTSHANSSSTKRDSPRVRVNFVGAVPTEVPSRDVSLPAAASTALESETFPFS